MILKDAILARIPLITCQTTDPLNAPAIIGDFAGMPVTHKDDFDLDEFRDSKTGAPIEQALGAVVVVKPFGDINQTYEEIYQFCIDANMSVILLNTEYSSPLFTDLGVIPVPHKRIEALFKIALDDDTNLPDYISTVNGLDLKNIAEIIKLTDQRDGAVTVQGLLQTRQAVAPKIEGLAQLNLNLPFYSPMLEVVEWVKTNKGYIKCDDIDPRLRPRGLMFTGMSGCGKTQGAKYLARELGLPLFKLDLNNLLTRWYGESEGKLLAALTKIDEESPCVVLMDEVEKLFKGTDEGTTGRMLASLLWWLQERTSNAIVVMTCNDISSLPVELYRDGRLNGTIEFIGITDQGDAIKFIKDLIKTYKDVKEPKPAVIKKAVEVAYKDADARGVSHAELTGIAERLIKNANPL